jgi:hypothetical protein
VAGAPDAADVPDRTAGEGTAEASEAAPRPERATGRGRSRRGASAARDALTSARRADETADEAPPPSSRSGRPTLGALARGKAAGGDDAPPAAPTADVVEPEADKLAPPSSDAPDRTPTLGSPPTSKQVEAAWAGAVLTALPLKVRSRWRSGRWADVASGAWRFAVPNAWHQGTCEETIPAVERALASHFGRPVTVTVVVDDDAPSGASPAGVAAPAGDPGSAAGHDEEEHVDPRDLRDADDAPGNGVDLVLREFGGGQVVEEGT